MKSIFHKFLISFLLSLALISSGKAISIIKIVDATTKLPIFEAKVSVINDSVIYYSDIKGILSYDSLNIIPGSIISISHPLYDLKIIQCSNADTITISLNSRLNIPYEVISNDTFGLFLIKNMIKHYKVKNLITQKYITYNKTTIESDEIEYINKNINKLLYFLNIEIPKLNEGQYLISTESLFETSFFNGNDFVNKLLSNNTIGIKDQTALSLSLLSFPINTTDEQLFIGGKELISPIHGDNLDLFNYKLIDTIDNEQISYRILFCSKKSYKNERILGIISIGEIDNSLVRINLILQRRNSYYLTYNQVEKWKQSLEKRTIEKATYLYFKSNKRNNISLRVMSNDYLSNFKNINKSKLEGKEIKFDLDIANPEFHKEHINDYRREPITIRDSLTSDFYAHIKNINNINNYLYFGQKIYFRKLNLKHFDLDISKIATINNLEGLRLGLGLLTDESISRKFTIGGYFGYGLKDNRFKYGSEFNFIPTNETRNFVKFSINDDVIESGGSQFPLEGRQFSSEGLRKLGLFNFDRIKSKTVSVYLTSNQYVKAILGIQSSIRIPQFNYIFNDNQTKTYDVSNTFIHLRFSIKEKYLKSNHQYFLLESNFPVVYFSLIKSINTNSINSIQYYRKELKVNFSRNIKKIGKLFLQANFGQINADVPYSLLFVQKGSFREFGPLIHNSFETMGYNEFVANKYFSLHISHNLGALLKQEYFVNPEVEILHNFGYGSLSLPLQHKFVAVKSLTNPFFESGIFLNNLLKTKISGVSTGLGLGGFLRYGYHYQPVFKDNLVAKFSINLSL